MAIHVPAGFKPRSYQRPVFDALDLGRKRFLWVWHRRSGKDRTALAVVAMQMIREVGNYFYVLPLFSWGRRSIWDNKDAAGRPFLEVFPPEVVSDINQTEMSVTLTNGSRLQVVGSDQVDRLRGVNFKGAVFSEFGWQSPEAWHVLSPVAVEGNARALFCSTPNGRNHFWDMYERHRSDANWFVSKLAIADTSRDAPGEDGSPVIPPDAVAEEIRSGMPEELAQQEYHCVPLSGMVGSIYGALLNRMEREGRLCDVPWDPAHLVTTASDIGVSDSTVFLALQEVGQMVHVIDMYEASGVGLAHYVKVLREWPYAYQRHLAPHDLNVQEFGSGQTRLETAHQLGIDFEVVERMGLEDGIDCVRNLFPRLRIDRTKCERLIQALGAYAYEWNAQAMLFSRRPAHTWASHPCDALRVYATAPEDVSADDFRPPPPSIIHFNVFDYNKRH